MSQVTVLGIFVADISFLGDKIPSVGETIIGKKYNIGPGGKGCNQAIAIARLGGKVNFISKIGKDEYGKLALDTLEENNIDTKQIIQAEGLQTGVAGIMINSKNGKNAINVITGAPSTFCLKDLEDKIEIIKKSKIFLTQLEIPKKITLHCLKEAKKNNVLTILNPAPASKLHEEFFDYIDFFTPNEIEAEFYTGIKINNEKDAKIASKKLLKKGIKKIVITLGEKGLYYSDGKNNLFLKANKVKAIDTTGAGDAFNGGLALALSKEKEIIESLKFANKVAGLSTTKIGAGNSMPFLKEI
tara:strand:+ start:547 stop:1446 length:900 start_codon:yes stop_codon:yes gene_type:complete